jgi:hypothetical protein
MSRADARRRVARRIRDGVHDCVSPKSAPAASRATTVAAKFQWVFILVVTACALASVAHALEDGGETRSMARRLLSFYYQRRPSGAGALKAKHGFSTHDGVKRGSQSANWVGDEIGRHVSFTAGGPLPEATAVSSEAGETLEDVEMEDPAECDEGKEWSKANKACEVKKKEKEEEEEKEEEKEEEEEEAAPEEAGEAYKPLDRTLFTIPEEDEGDDEWK